MMSGQEVLSDDAKLLRTGYTTGSCATAAAKAALTQLLRGDESENGAKTKIGAVTEIDKMTITTPSGTILEIPIEAVFKSGAHSVTGVVIKDAGDDADVTHELEICARVSLNHTGEIHITGGVGVGKVTKPGLQIPVGEYAINPVPLQMIKNNLQPLLGEGVGVEVTIEVPHGAAVALKTFNPRLGVVGGISIIGTSGIVRPMSEEAFKETIYTEMKQKKALGITTLVMVPGLHGEKYAIEHILLAEAEDIAEISSGLNVKIEQVVHMGNYVGFSLQAAETLGFEKVLLVGHIGKFVKLAGGIFNTHSKVADAKAAIVICELALMGAPMEIIEAIHLANTTDEMAQYLVQTAYDGVFQKLAEKAKTKCTQFVFDGIDIDVVLYDMAGRLLGDSRRRQAI